MNSDVWNKVSGSESACQHIYPLALFSLQRMEREREGENHLNLNHFYFEGDGSRSWPNLPTGLLRKREGGREGEID